VVALGLLHILKTIKKMNLPKRAEDVHASLADAFNTKKLDVVMSIYDGAGIIVPEPEKPVSGKEKFVEAVKAILAIPGKMQIKTVYCLQTGDVAVGRSEWNIKDGNETKVSAKGIELMKRQPDGTWKIVVDHAFGAEESLLAK
jgi:ketosteroid isomerase-like protein